MQEFKIRDRVKLLYGHIAMMSESEYIALRLTYPVIEKRTLHADNNPRLYVDILPELVGKEGVIVDIDGNSAMVEGIPGKTGWWGFNTLKKV
jgi:hypothetical protein